MKRRLFRSTLLGLLVAGACAPAPTPVVLPAPVHLVDDVEAARLQLEEERGRAVAVGGAPAERLRRLTRLGLWEQAEALVAATPSRDADFSSAVAELRVRQHRYPEAAALAERALAATPGHPAARRLRARLQIQAWELPAAAATLDALLRDRPGDAEAALLLGRVRLLEKRYAEALRIAREVQAREPGSAGAHLLEADVHFWTEDLAAAEPPLLRALAADPFDPDARFAFGYALWRRVDATLLDQMAAQWNLALEVDPLHYLTHWHFGNGHTHHTYADYATSSDSTVRGRLAFADSLIARGRTGDALEVARRVELDFPNSALPPMLRASAFYLAHDLERGERLDSAETIFREILDWKRNYGPAHNGLAAVIKQRQVEVLAGYDSLEAAIANTPAPPDDALAAVFPDLRYYPGDRVEKMVRQQLAAAAAYLPLIARQERRYRIPPLHQDLASAMGDASLRTATTFDNRQWMDVRGAGSGAAGVEYVERGSHQERNVLLHEFVHLVHETVFTDEEKRRVRDLYHQAMEEGRTLDYYAANNEAEFLAQAYTAFFSPVLVHPLNHKSLATREDLQAKDPATFAFVDSLVARAHQALAGHPGALRSNWAQAYVNLSERARTAAGGPERWTTAAALLDTALVRDSAYLPAVLSYAALERDRGRYDEAEGWLARAEGLDPLHAGVPAARAALLGVRGRAERSPGSMLEEQVALYRLALRRERDLAERGLLSRTLRDLLRAHGRIPEAIGEAEAYLAAAPTVSTYLRDRRDEAEAFIHVVRADFGYGSETVPFFRARLARRPQDVVRRVQLADVLVGAGRDHEALAVLEEGQRLFLAAGRVNAEYASRIAEIRLRQGDARGAGEAVRPLLDAEPPLAHDDLRLARVLQSLGQTTEAHRRMAAFPYDASPRATAEFEYTRGWIEEWREDPEMAERAYRAALAADPYHRAARLSLVALLRARGRLEEARAEADAAEALPLPPGPDLRAALRAADPEGR